MNGEGLVRHGDSALREVAKRPVSVTALVLLEAILAFFGFASGSQFILDPSGGTHGMDTSILEGTPVGNFLLVGVFFVTCYGILQILTIYGLWRLPRWRWTDPVNKWTGQNWAWTAAAATGVILIVWILVEVYYIGSPDGFPRFLQVTFAALGAVMLALAFLPRARAYAKLAVSPRSAQDSRAAALPLLTGSSLSQDSGSKGRTTDSRRRT